METGESAAPGEWDSRPPIKGIEKIISWFGGWPFHDAEILDLFLVRNGTSRMTVHTWNLSQTRRRDGLYMEKEAVVRFSLEQVIDIDIEGFNHQNVIDKLAIEAIDGGFRMTLKPCYGLWGRIDAKNISAKLTPGAPRDPSRRTR